MNKKGKITSVSFALMLIISTFAFAYMIGSEVKVASAVSENIDYNNIYSIDGNYYAQVKNSNLVAGYNPSTKEWALNPFWDLNTVYKGEHTSLSDFTKKIDSLESLPKNDGGVPAPEATKQATVIPTSIKSGLFTTNIGTLRDAGAVTWDDKAKAYKEASTGKYYNRLGYEVKGSDAQETSIGETPFGDITPLYGAGYLLQGIGWAAIAGGLVVTLGGMFIKDKANLNAAAAGIAAGILVGRGVVGGLFARGGLMDTFGWGGQDTWVGTTLGSYGGQAVIGAATAWMVYNAMWSSEKVSVETVTFNCLPWQAPNGGADCELCNDETLPCSEYRCKSLGQSCEIVNKGTKEERCVNVNPRDSSPPIIIPNKEDLSSGFEYFDIVEMPPGAGFKIRSKGTTTGCLPAYTPIQFGITTNEPSQCKIDIEPKGNYSKMAAFINGDNLYKYNHTEFLNLPSSADIKNSTLTLKNGKELVFYLRCRDAAGNTNEADYAMTLCVDPSPDNTAPLILGTSIQNKGCVPADAENATVEFYINEPSQCKWDYYDRDYEQMSNNMSCSTSAIEINAIQSYTCATQLKGIGRDGNNFYVRCKDQPEGINESKRNKMQESYIFNLRRSNQLKLKLVQPNETIYGAVRPAPVELYAETLFGCEDNKAICYYSTTGALNSFVQFFDTDKADGVHTQRLDLNDGSYNYFVRCIDAGGNVANMTTSFKVSIDVNAPIVARAYEEDGYLKLVTPLNSECVYNSNSCDFLFSEGTQMPYANSTTHVTEWFPDKKYFIKCRDEYRSEPVDCSLVIRPTENFLGN